MAGERTNRRFRDDITDLKRNALTRSIGVVTSVSPLTITIAGISFTPVSALGNFVPVVGDNVWCSWSGKDILAHGVIVSSALQSVSFATGWSNNGGGYNDAKFYRSGGRVWLQGAVKNGGTGTGAIFTLDSGYRPPATMAFPVAIFGATGQITISTGGVVTDATFSAGSKAFLSLEGVSFRLS